MKNVVEDKVFDKYNFESEINQEFSGCTFKNCDFSEKLFDKAEFIDCHFTSCNLSMAKFNNTILNKAFFTNCKLMGVDFSQCSRFLFSASFDNCILNFCLFHKNDLKNTIFKNCMLHEASFMECDLSNSKFLSCDLERCIFERSNLEKADFVTAINYTINPEINKLKKAKFSFPEVMGLLNDLDIVIVES
jgi:fluoroquinolone resistance protein